MVTSEPTIWAIRAGRHGEADNLFRKGKKIALGWDEMGDLSVLPADRDAFKERVVEVYGSYHVNAVANHAGQLFRFVHEMQLDDIVIYPCKSEQRIYIGRIKGGYEFSNDQQADFVHRRTVAWQKDFPRTIFSQGALYEIGSALTLFQVKNHADEFLAALSGGVLPVVDGEDETVGPVAEDIEQTTRDFILKTLAKELKGHPFADFVANLLQTMGYRTRVSPEGPDGGVDIVAHRDDLGFEPPIIKVQVKSKEGTTGDPEVSSLYGKVGTNEFGLLVALGTFSAQARTFAREKSNLRLIDGRELVTFVLEHYEDLDARYKGILPLKRVWVPERLEEAGG